MKKTIILIAFLILISTGYSQIVQSSCDASEDVIEDYNVDAGVLTLRKFYNNDLTYKDSIEIPTEDVDTILNALLAVWNATELPARDTVVDMFEISAAFNYDVRVFSIKCDTSIVWANNLIDGIEETGNDTVDSLLNKYQLEYYFHLNLIENNYIYLLTDVNYNMLELSKNFELISGVISVYASSGQYSNHMDENITAEIHTEYVDLEYSFGWGDCMNGCFFWRYWGFRVYYDCSVEYVGSHGYTLLGSDVQDAENSLAIHVFPNPFDNKISISGIVGIFEFSIYNINGEILQKGVVVNNVIDTQNILIPGIYFLELHNNNTVVTKKIYKFN